MLGRQAALLATAIQFLTRLPVPTLSAFQPAWISRSARYFPIAGQLVGLICAIVWLAASAIWPGWPAAVLALGAGVLVTGGFHEDGLADTADGLGGGQTRERRLAIMKDSRIGSFGALALTLALLLKLALLARLTPLAGALALIVAHGGARAAAVVVMAALPYAGDPDAAKIKPAPEGVRWREAMAALVLGLWPLLFLEGRRASLGLALAAVSSAVLALVARRLINGVTGDVLGAIEQLAEAAFLMGAAWI
jgi:adenosylcobinamide-GDP ribazoletransferase